VSRQLKEAAVLAPETSRASYRKKTGRLTAEVADVNVGAQPGIVGEVPALVVGVLVNHDIVAVPKPIIGVGKVKRGDAEVVAAKPETAGIASLNAPAVSAAEAAVETAMLPGVIDVEADVIASAFVPHPLAVTVDVGSFGVAYAVVVGAAGRVFVMIFTMFFASLIGGRTVVGNVSATDVVVAVAAVVMVAIVMVVSLRQDGQGEDEE
jgi:hypothetical protein